MYFCFFLPLSQKFKMDGILTLKFQQWDSWMFFLFQAFERKKEGKKKDDFHSMGVFLLTNKQTFLGPLGFFIWSLLLILALLSILLNATSVYGKHGDFCFFRRVCFLRYGVMYLMRTEQTNWQKGDCFLFFSSVCFDSLLSSY